MYSPAPPPYTATPQPFPPAPVGGQPGQNYGNVYSDEKQQPMQSPPPAFPGPQINPLGQPAMSPEQQQELQKLLQSMPPEKMQQVLQAANNPQPPAQYPPISGGAYGAPPLPGVFAAPPVSATYKPPTPAATPAEVKDQQKSGRAKRFFGDTLVGRFARASVATASCAVKMPAALSPWGDNNPVTLPNVRYRDAVLFTTFAFVGAPLIEGADGLVTDVFGADSFVSEIVSSGAGAIVGSTILKYGIFQIVEQAIDKGILEHLLPEEEKMTQTTNVTSLQVTIKHKLMGVDADIRFWGLYPTQNTRACEKGWFCPYLFASARTPMIPRANEFGVAQCFGPFLGADYALAHKLLSESANVLSFCNPDPTANLGTNRVLVLFTGLAPYRGMWSQSRRPGCGLLVFHVFNGCPALVLPVTARCPLVAWSPWTLSEMRASLGHARLQGAAAAGQPVPWRCRYDAEIQHGQICEWLDTVVSVEHVDPKLQGKYVDVLGRAVSLVINGALALDRAEKTVLGKVDPERAGIVMLRY